MIYTASVLIEFKGKNLRDIDGSMPQIIHNFKKRSKMEPNYDKYMDMWNNMVITDEEAVIEAAKLILEGREVYEEVVKDTGVPWQIIGLTHYREGSCIFNTHPHNGDSLKKRTVNVPAGRPLVGEPPFTWQESAWDCYFNLKHLDKVPEWSLPVIMWQLEAFNGLGYLKYHPTVPSPYIWSKTAFYTKGKYASDGKFDPELVDKQTGCAPLFRYLSDKTLGLV